MVGKRFAKKQQMQWSKAGAHLLLQTRTRPLDGTLRKTFRKWYPVMAANDTHPPVPFTGQTVDGTVAPLTDRAGPPGATFCPLCSEHLGGTRAPAAGRG